MGSIVVVLVGLSMLLPMSSDAQRPMGFPDYTPNTFPDSITQATLCGLARPAFICDPNHVVNEGNATKDQIELDMALLRVRGETNCSCDVERDTDRDECDRSPRGFTVSIAVVEKMRLANNESDRQAILRGAQAFAEKVRWRQNRGQCNDDVLIFLSASDNVVWTAVGEVTAMFLTRDVIRLVSDQGEEFFKRRKYREGLDRMVEQYKRVLQGKTVEKLWNWPLPLWLMILLAVIGCVLAVVALGVLTMCVIKCFRKDRRDEYQLGTRL